MKIVLIISANAEWLVVKDFLPGLEIHNTPYGEYAHLKLGTRHLILFHGGWGKVSAAATTQYAVDHFHPDLIVNLGTCGGFAGHIKTGAVILVEQTLLYDILEQMGDGTEAIKHYTTYLDLSWMPQKLPFPVLRGLLISADRDIVADDIPMLIEKYGAVAADWESGAIAWVANKNNIRLLILRAVTDLVGGGGGETYGNIGLFQERTKTEMKKLLEQLPEWLAIAEIKNPEN